MAHVVRIIKASILGNKLTNYIKEKEIALNEDEANYKYSKRKTYKPKISNRLFDRFVASIQTPNTIENLVFKSFVGFVGGVLLTYIFFCFLYIGVNFSLKSTTYTCALAGIFLSLGLAFSSKIRCYVLLFIPVFFSKEGRQVILTYALFLSFTGPAKNSMHNMKILSDSMTCGQEIVKRTLKQLIEMVKAPFISIKETVEKMKKSLEEVIEKIKNFAISIKRIIISVLNVIKKATSWLGSIVNFCNKKIGTPFQRCMRTFEESITDCKAKLGIMDFLCHVVHLVKGLCYTVKWLDFICLFTEFVSEKIIGVVKRKLREFNLQMKNLFYVSIEYSHTYEFDTKPSRTTKDLARAIVEKVNEKVEKIQSFFSFCGFMFSFLFLFVFFKVYYYKYKYLSSDRYDNMYISDYILDLDIKRAQMDRETVLPLEPREKKLYGKPTTIRLLAGEKNRIAQSMFLLTLTTFKIITFIAIDYSLFWTLMTIYEAGRIEYEEVEKSTFGLHIKGKGILANFYRNLGHSFKVPDNPNLRISPLHCLPDPVEPDFGRYIQIGFLLTVCWILTVTEAYGLRLRNVVMSYYYPDRARERAVWLYNHILQSRGSFLRYARRQLRRKFGVVGQKPIERITLTQRLFAGFPLLGALFGKNTQNNCLLCGAPETENEPLKRCKTPDCPGRYCINCFAHLENVCTICQHPIEYGDISDISDEVDSSEEDLYKQYQESRQHLASDEARDGKKFETFKEMQVRKRFKDVEAYQAPDYVKLGDLYQDKAALKAKLREAINRHIQNIEREKYREEEHRRSELHRIKSKLQNLTYKLKKKKSDLHKANKTKKTKNYYKDSVTNIKHHKFENEDDEEEALLDKKLKRTKTKVSFKTSEKESEAKCQDGTDVRKKIKTLKEPKNEEFEQLLSDSSE